MAYKHLTFNDRLKIEAWQKDDKPAEILRYYKIPIMSLKLYLMENLIKIGLYLLIYQKKIQLRKFPIAKMLLRLTPETSLLLLYLQKS